MPSSKGGFQSRKTARKKPERAKKINDKKIEKNKRRINQINERGNKCDICPVQLSKLEGLSERSLAEEESQTKLDLLQVRQEAENVRLPTDNERAELIVVTNRLQAIHDKAENAAKSDLLEQVGSRLIAMETNNVKDIINDARACEQIADELINRQK